MAAITSSAASGAYKFSTIGMIEKIKKLNLKNHKIIS